MLMHIDFPRESYIRSVLLLFDICIPNHHLTVQNRAIQTTRLSGEKKWDWDTHIKTFSCVSTVCNVSETR